MKTLIDLNGKWWYRLLKVIYIFIFAVAWLTTIWVAATTIHHPEIDSVNRNTSYLSCDGKDGGKYLFSSYETAKWYINSTSFDVKELNSECAEVAVVRWRSAHPAKGGITQEEASAFDKITHATTSTIVRPYSYADELEAVWAYEAMDFRPQVVIYRIWWKIILNFLLGLVGVPFVFELFRRIFYYIVLGKIFPKV